MLEEDGKRAWAMGLVTQFWQMQTDHVARMDLSLFVLLRVVAPKSQAYNMVMSGKAPLVSNKNWPQEHSYAMSLVARPGCASLWDLVADGWLSKETVEWLFQPNDTAGPIKRATPVESAVLVESGAPVESPTPGESASATDPTDPTDPTAPTDPDPKP
jgi:hypothetical protein